MARVEEARPDTAAAHDTTKVFISYSRKDSSFVDRLAEALEREDHIEAFRDTEDVLPTEEWKSRLERLIGEADTIVFCLSPDAVASQVCRWEVEVAERLNKRIAPIVVRDVAGPVPAAIDKLNYIFFTRNEDFDRSLGYLVTALDADISWIREHTRLGEIARRWERNDRPNDQLLRGVDLHAAQAWSGRQPRSAPDLTLTTRSFIAASWGEHRAQARRARRAKVLLYGLLVCIVAGLAGWLNQSVLQEQWRWLTVVRPYIQAHVRPHVLAGETERALKAGAEFKDCPACPPMVVVPAGSFTMGSSPGEPFRNDDEGPQHQVTIGAPFAVSKFEITLEEWDVCVAYGNCEPRLDEPEDKTQPRTPAVNVSWFDVQRYVAWLSQMTGKRYRLLSESEWEYAARGGTQTAYSWGDDIGEGRANCEKCGSEWDRKQATSVGSFKPNAFGLYDVHGNVWEWVEDCYNATYEEASPDATALKSGRCARRVVRSGSWDYSPGGPRSAARYRYHPVNKVDDVGFRIARSIERGT